ncbi:uncharacterized protein N0V89_007697 [Didymosphaeria variabile]|uniref:Uncharacterized protein n=1 Tax=Didymosphaeria variabile TaxID=1932322 RepID=A0A9W8XJV9_9PLEO|nr:uncharacterized protein N0V89_007697 [Didymosphaeria variabile]KAJ4352349.1 hypothetical protein N0V89_007697 [Didymosphaeria variabile]
MYKKQRRKQAKQARKARTKLQEEQPELYHHPEPTGTNPYWQEEIFMGPGPPPRRARKTNTCNTRATTTAGTQGSAVSQTGSSIDVDRAVEVRLSDDTLDDDNWNRKRYQREDEDLWGFDAIEPLQTTLSGSSVGVTGLKRPTSRSGSYYSARAPPVNDLHPPVVSLPSPHPSDNQWMLQPPPKASVMSGKERATLRSRSGSGASSRVELSLQRQVSAKHLRDKLDRGETPEMPSLSRGISYNDMLMGQRHDRPKTPLARPPSTASSYRPRRRRDTAMTNTSATEQSSSDSSDTIVRRSHSPSHNLSTVPSLKLMRARSSRQQLSTVMSSGSGEPSISPTNTSPTPELDDENLPVTAIRKVRYSTQSTESDPYHLKKRRAPLVSSDISSLNVLQDLVSPVSLLSSRFVSAPLMEARIKLPPSDHDEQNMLDTDSWSGSGFAISRGWVTDQVDGEARVPFDSARVADRDPRMRWSVDF